MRLQVRPVPVEDHLEFVTRYSGSFLQTPAWAAVKAEWGHERLGWYLDDGSLVGTAVVLLRQIPRVKRYLAYIPEGPVMNWEMCPARESVPPLLEHLKRRGVFTVKIGPQVVVKTLPAEQIKAAIAAGTPTRLHDLPSPEDTDATAVADELRRLGWEQDAQASAGWGDYQPRYVFRVPLWSKSTDELLAGFNQLWRRNIKKAEKDGVEVTQGGADDLAAFHELYLETARRDAFTPRALHYFQRMWQAMRAEDPDRIRLYLARREGTLLAAATWVRVGQRVWYSYGASSTDGREHRASNAMQWRMLRDAKEAGARYYDMRGISDTLDPDDHLFGLLQFKLGTGGEAVEYVGEFDYPLSPVLHRAFRLYLARRR